MTQTKLPEELPRYIIDADLPRDQKESKILSEEQERAIHKLLKAASHILSDEERDLVYRLMDKLHQETERVRSLKKVMVHDKPLDAYLNKAKKKSNHKFLQSSDALDSTLVSEDLDLAEQEGEDEAPSRPKTTMRHVVGFSPEEVVRRYIECWNQQKFGAEYDCFSSDFMQIDRGTYVQARQTSYLQMLNRGGMRVDFGVIVDSTLAGGDAEIVATKITQEPGRKPREDKDLYKLKIERGHWVIYKVVNLD
ncbi:MAG: hypothetical protein RBU29_11015 [bacterium]|jgi:hypothetical protein|nr:hypothetical protein [bacterium]